MMVATSTLELGIDVGDLDRVIQIDAPPTVAALQRLGRALILATSDPRSFGPRRFCCGGARATSSRSSPRRTRSTLRPSRSWRGRFAMAAMRSGSSPTRRSSPAHPAPPLVAPAVLTLAGRSWLVLTG